MPELQHIMRSHLFRETYRVAELLYGFSKEEWAMHLQGIHRCDLNATLKGAFNWAATDHGHFFYSAICRIAYPDIDYGRSTADYMQKVTTI